MLNENLIKIRKDHGLTQEALAAKLNVVRQTVSKWERGTAVPDADTLCRIADALEVPVSALLGSPEPEDTQDLAAVAIALSQINEQLAVKNRRSANFWKILVLVLLAAAAVFFFCNSRKDAFSLSDLSVSNVHFTSEYEGLYCSFVPNVENKNIRYTVIIYHTGGINVSAEAKYENGVCTALFGKSALSNCQNCDVLLQLGYKGKTQNYPLARNLDYHEGSTLWEPY